MKRVIILLVSLFFLSCHTFAESPDCFSGKLIKEDLGLGGETLGIATFSEQCAHKNTEPEWPRPARNKTPGWGQAIMCFPDLNQCQDNRPQDEAYLSFTIPKYKSVQKMIDNTEASYHKVSEIDGIGIYRDKEETRIRYVFNGEEKFLATCLQSHGEFSSCELIGLAPYEVQYFLKSHHVNIGADDWASVHKKVSSFIDRAVQPKM